MTGKQIYNISNGTLKQGIVSALKNVSCYDYYYTGVALFSAQLNQIEIKNNYLSRAMKHRSPLVGWIMFNGTWNWIALHARFTMPLHRRRRRRFCLAAFFVPNQFPFRCSKFQNRFMACRQINCSLIPICYCVLLTWFCVLLIKINNCRRQLERKWRKPVPSFTPSRLLFDRFFGALNKILFIMKLLLIKIVICCVT